MKYTGKKKDHLAVASCWKRRSHQVFHGLTCGLSRNGASGRGKKKRKKKPTPKPKENPSFLLGTLDKLPCATCLTAPVSTLTPHKPGKPKQFNSSFVSYLHPIISCLLQWTMGCEFKRQQLTQNRLHRGDLLTYQRTEALFFHSCFLFQPKEEKAERRP